MTGDTTGACDLPALLTAPAATAEQVSVFQALGTARAMRYLRTDPVPAAHIEALVWAATRASSADNSQPWQFVAVTSAGQRQAIADAVAPIRSMVESLPGPVDGTGARTRRGADHLVGRLASVPLLLFVCGSNDYPAIQPQERYLWSAVFAATQNAIVAARALGLGAVFTMLHVAAPGRVREILGVPPGVKIAAMLAVGWPERPSGPMSRKPLGEVLHHDRW